MSTVGPQILGHWTHRFKDWSSPRSSARPRLRRASKRGFLRLGLRRRRVPTGEVADLLDDGGGDGLTMMSGRLGHGVAPGTGERGGRRPALGNTSPDRRYCK